MSSRPPRGAFMRRHVGGTDRGRRRRCGGLPRWPAPGNSRSSADAAPAGVVTQPRTRAASGLRPGVQRPPARSWLTSGPTAVREAWPRDPDESAARRRKEIAAVERREAPPPYVTRGRNASQAFPAEVHPPRRGARRPPGAFRRSASPHAEGKEMKGWEEGVPGADTRIRAAERWLRRAV